MAAMLAVKAYPFINAGMVRIVGTICGIIALALLITFCVTVSDTKTPIGTKVAYFIIFLLFGAACGGMWWYSGHLFSNGGLASMEKALDPKQGFLDIIKDLGGMGKVGPAEARAPPTLNSYTPRGASVPTTYTPAPKPASEPSAADITNRTR